MIGRADRAGVPAPARARVQVVVPGTDRAHEGAGRRTFVVCLALGRQVATGPERLAGRRRTRSAAPLPEGGSAPGSPAPDGRPEPTRPARPEHEVEVEVPVVRPAELRAVHQLGRDLEQEPRRHRRLAHPPGRAAPGVRQEEPLLGAGDADVGEAALLLELLLVVERPAVREEALLQPGDEDDRELEALRRVERDQGDGVGVALVRVLVGDERRLLEQPVERVVRCQIVVPGRDRAQLEQVRPAFLAILGAVGEHRAIAGRLECLVQQLREGQHPDPGPQPAHE